jgi:hypothetical protein
VFDRRAKVYGLPLPSGRKEMLSTRDVGRRVTQNVANSAVRSGDVQSSLLSVHSAVPPNTCTCCVIAVTGKPRVWDACKGDRERDGLPRFDGGTQGLGKEPAPPNPLLVLTTPYVEPSDAAG